MIPIPRFLYEQFCAVWGEAVVKQFCHPAPVGFL